MSQHLLHGIPAGKTKCKKSATIPYTYPSRLPKSALLSTVISVGVFVGTGKVRDWLAATQTSVCWLHGMVDTTEGCDQLLWILTSSTGALPHLISRVCFLVKVSKFQTHARTNTDITDRDVSKGFCFWHRIIEFHTSSTQYFRVFNAFSSCKPAAEACQDASFTSKIQY